MIQMYEKWATELLDKVSNMDEAVEQRKRTVPLPGKVVMEKPTVEFLWDFMFDAIHHRGQLSAYLRARGRQGSSDLRTVG
jgi:uncharacterized damage-inducible protein DinB